MEGHHDGPNSESSSPVYLAFPTLLVHDSIASLASNLEDAMRPAPPSRTSSEALSSVDDSTYDIVSVGEASEGGLLSDDDTRTESLASVDGHTADDISVVNEEDEGDRTDYGLDSLASLAAHTDTNRFDSLVDVRPSIEDSGFTSRTERPSSASQSLAYLDFTADPTEPTTGAGEKNLVHVFQSIKDVNTTTELSVYGTSHVGLAMHLAVTDRLLRRAAPFRVLIIVHHEHLTGDIVSHLKAALDANILQKSGPNHQECQLVVDQCRAAWYDRDGRTIHLAIEGAGGAVSVSGGRIHTSDRPYPQPDLAVFLHPSLADVPAHNVTLVEDNFALTRHAMLSCNVPIMDLSEYHPLYLAPPHSYTYRRKSLHLRVEIKQDKESEPRVAEFLPVDLDKFLAIDPATLSRHLYCLTSRSTASVVGSRSSGASALAFSKALSGACVKSLQVLGAVGRTIIQALNAVGMKTEESLKPIRDIWDQIALRLDFRYLLFLLSVLSMALTYFASSSSFQVARIEPPGQEAASCVHTAAQGLTTEQSTAGFTYYTKMTSSVASYSNEAGNPPVIRKIEGDGLGDEKSLSKLANELRADMNAAQLTFDVDVVGDNNFVLTPTRPGIAAKKLKVSVSVFRESQLVESHVDHLSSGAYVVMLEREQAYGPLDVTVSYKSGKALFKQELHVDLGSPWLKPSTWGKAAETVQQALHDDLTAAQTTAQALSVRMTTSLQKYALHIGKEGQKMSKEAFHRIDDTRKALAKISTETALTQWKSFQQLRANDDLTGAKKQFAGQSNKVAWQLGTTARGVQQAAVERYYDAIGTIRAMDLSKMLTVKASLFPSKALSRGRRNAIDMVKILKGEKARKKMSGCGGCQGFAKQTCNGKPIGAKFSRKIAKAAKKVRRV